MQISERDFQSQILQLASMTGWLCYHTYDSRRCQAGYPDLAMVHPVRHEYLLVELKTDRGRVRPTQREWIDALRSAGVEVWVWRPSDWKSIVERLTRQAVVKIG